MIRLAVAVGDEGLLAGDLVLIALLFRAGLDALQVGTGAGLGHRDGADEFARRHPGQPLALLLFRTVVEDVGRDDRVMQRGAETVDALLGDLLHEHDLVAIVAAGAAIAFGNA
jgi:hypothetical protein